MKKILSNVCLLWLVIFMSLPTMAYGFETTEPEPETTEYDGYLIAMADDFAPNATSLEYIAPDVYFTDDEDTAHELLQEGYAEYIEPNYAVSLFSLEDDANWSYDMVGGVDAESLGLRGDGVRIAVIDSGVDVNNINLAGAKIVDGYDYLEHTSKQTDTVGHGTYVCQVLAGSGDLGVTGIARDAELIPLRCFSATEGSVSDIIAAIYDAVATYQCDIINMSWGMEENSTFLEEALRKAHSEGIILVAAAGNVSKKANQGTLFYPAAYPEVIGVGSVGKTSVVSATSQQTEAVCVCAPGEEIAMTSLSGVLVAQSGTSFAAPYITGEIALIKQLNSEIDTVGVITLLQERSIDLGDEGYDTSYGYGLAKITELLGQSWYTPQITEDALKVTGWMRNDTGGYVVSAFYNEAGRMLDCELFRIEAPIASYEFEHIIDATEARLFFINEYFTPVTSHYVFPLRESDDS